MGTAGSDVPHQVGWRVTTCVAYGASQLPRIAWCVGHGLAVRRLFEAAQQRDGKKAQPSAHTNLPVPHDGMRVLLDFVRLDRDCGQLRNVGSTVTIDPYSPPAGRKAELLRWLTEEGRFAPDTGRLLNYSATSWLRLGFR